MLTFNIKNNGNGTVTISGTNGSFTKNVTIDSDFLECIKDIDQIDPISLIQNTIQLQYNLGEKNEN